MPGNCECDVQGGGAHAPSCAPFPRPMGWDASQRFVGHPSQDVKHENSFWFHPHIALDLEGDRTTRGPVSCVTSGARSLHDGRWRHRKHVCAFLSGASTHGFPVYSCPSTSTFFICSHEMIQMALPLSLSSFCHGLVSNSYRVHSCVRRTLFPQIEHQRCGCGFFLGYEITFFHLT